MKSKVSTLLFFGSLALPVAAQENTCRDLIYDYDSGSYRNVIDYVVAGKDSIKDGCSFNIAGLSVFKLPDATVQENRDLGLWLFSRSASLGYPAGSYNFYKYTYLKTNADLGMILDGLGHLIASSSNNDDWRSASLKSISLGNQIISECGSPRWLASNCQNRRVTYEQRVRFESSTSAGLSTVSDDLPRRNQEAKRSLAVIDNLITLVGIGLVMSPMVMGNIAAPAAATTKPVDPFLFSDPYRKPMTCWNGNCW